MNWKIEIKTKIYKPLLRETKGSYEIEDKTHEVDSLPYSINW